LERIYIIHCGTHNEKEKEKRIPEQKKMKRWTKEKRKQGKGCGWIEN